jgi:hypothetical protein
MEAVVSAEQPAAGNRHRPITEGGAMQEVARFEDKFGDERIIHKTRHGLKVKRTHATPILQMNPIVGGLVGQRVIGIARSAGTDSEGVG